MQTLRPVGGRRRLQGVLRGLEGDAVRLQASEGDVSIPFAEIAKANLVVRF